jgi:hypothetical protein
LRSLNTTLLSTWHGMQCTADRALAWRNCGFDITEQTAQPLLLPAHVLCQAVSCGLKLLQLVPLHCMKLLLPARPLLWALSNSLLLLVQMLPTAAPHHFLHT